MKTFVKIVFVCVVYIYSISYVYAEDITVYKSLLPKRFMTVDKKQQLCTLYGTQDTPINYTCSSGQVDGDKEVEGDKKTPEGVYFITGSISEGLDFEEYGSRAYPLNYPNPIDTIEQKTGYGIWVHGKGPSVFKKYGTRGCVAFNENDMLVVYPNFIVSYPVIIGETVTLKEDEPSSDYIRIKDAVYSWARTWTEQQNDFFTHYDGSKKANFEHFVNNKRYFFNRFDFTFVDIDEPYIVRKGDYYVVWFRQYYYAPNMVIEGIRYLYWQLGEDNVPRILVEEWKPDTSSTTKETLGERLESRVNEFLAEWKDSWEKGDVTKYSAMYTSNASQGNIRGNKAIAKSKERIWKKNKPEKISIENVQTKLTPKGIEVRFKQTYQASGKYMDIGEKVLYIVPQSNSTSKWKITKETWRRLSK